MRVLTASARFGHSDCERIVDGALAQPVLAVTSLAYVAAGLVVLGWSMRWRSPLAWAAAIVLVAVGVGSFAFHGPQPSWAKPAHDLPIIAAGVVYAAVLARSRRPRWRSVAPAAGVFAVGWRPTPPDGRGRRCAGPTACGSTTAPGMCSLPSPRCGPLLR